MKELCFQDRLLPAFKKYKRNIAIKQGMRQVTYWELEKRSGCILNWLLENDIKKETFIGIYIDDKIDLIAALLGIIKAGCVWVPINPGYPVKRVEHMVRATHTPIILCDDRGRERLHLSGAGGENLKMVVLDDAFYAAHAAAASKGPIPYSREDKIYVYFTSGTTGSPNAVVGKNKSLLHFIDWEIFTFSIDEAFRVSQLNGPEFDAFLRDVFVTLAAGATICIPDGSAAEMTGNGRQLAHWIDSEKIRLMHCVPSVFRGLNSADAGVRNFTHLKYILLAGERLTPADLKKWYDKFGDGIQLVNLYGPTETTMVKTFYIIDKKNIPKDKIPIGKPMKGARVLILDKQLNICGEKTVGEIYIRTPYGTFGYYDDPGLTKQRFIPNPFSGDPTDLFYKTGDLGRMLPDGNIEFIGRKDRQIKIKGVRVEPEEIEQAMLTHPGISEAAVTGLEDPNGETFLAAYYVSEKTVTPGEIKEYLALQLPAYLLPAQLVPIENIPLQPGGKTDFKALPPPGTVNKKTAPAAPLNEIERTLVKIWSEILETDGTAIGIDDSFTHLDGQSLKAIMIASWVHKEFNVSVPIHAVFELSTIRRMAEYIKESVENKYRAIGTTEEKEYYTLSPGQKRLYIIKQMELESIGYNVPHIVPLEGDLDIEKLTEVFNRLVKRHETFRTSFKLMGAEPVQTIRETVDFSIKYDDLTGGREVSIPHQSPEVKGIVKNFIRPFNLEQAPLIRVGLIKTGERKYILMVDMHHIISDAASRRILLADFLDLYEGKELPGLRLRYRDYSEWINSPARREMIQKQESYWLEQFKGELPVLNLPTDFQRPRVYSFEGGIVMLELGKRETTALQKLAMEQNATLFMVFLAVFNVFLAKICGQEDIVVGTPLVGRRHAELQNIIGIFINTLALRNYPRGEKTFVEFLGEIRGRSFNAFENQYYPFEDLVDRLSVKRDMSRNPLCDVMFGVQEFEEKKRDLSRLGLSLLDEDIYDYGTLISKVDLQLDVIFREHLYLLLEYSSKLFKRETIERFTVYIKKILMQIVDNPGIKIHRLNIVSEEEKQRILYDFNDNAAAYPHNQTIHRLFETQVEKTPGAAAVAGYGGANAWTQGDNRMHITYTQLDGNANQLGHFLRGKGVKPDTIVGIMMERSTAMITAILGILKAGGAYLPIEPGTPRDRCISMLNDGRAAFLLSHTHLLGKYSFTTIQNLDEEQVQPHLTPARPAIKDLDTLPVPDRSMVNYRKYHKHIGLAPVKHTVSIQGTRGCPYQCLYCHKIWPKKHLARSAEHTFDEIRKCYDAGVKRFAFVDDIFNLKLKNSTRFLEMIVKSNMDVQFYFPNGVRGDILTEGFIDLMMTAGTVDMLMALETASPRVQKLVKKNLNLDRFRHNLQYIIKHYPHVNLEMNIMIGFPTETEEEALASLEFLKKQEWIHFPNMHLLKIYPNTGMYRLAIENGISRESIRKSINLGYHELPETLPFSKGFARKYQTRFLEEYFLLKERLLHVLPSQMKIFSEDELIQKYDSYLPAKIRTFPDILRFCKISREELGDVQFFEDDRMAAPDFQEKFGNYDPPQEKDQDALRILLLDLSLLFSPESEGELYSVVEPPLGLMYLLTYLNGKFPRRIRGKIIKSQIDFDNYEELRKLADDFQPELICIRTLSYYRNFFHRVTALLRQWGVSAPIITGGPYATSEYPGVLQDRNVDLVVLGEGEITLAEVVEKMLDNGKKFPGEEVLQEIQGTAFVKRKNKPRLENKYREVIQLDRLVETIAGYPCENIEAGNRATDLCYVIFTSGSTGRPKGTLTHHGNVIPVVKNSNYIDIKEEDRLLQLSNYAFDGSVFDIYGALLNGALLVLPPAEKAVGVDLLAEIINREKITVFFVTTALFNLLVDEKPHLFNQIRHVLFGGERVSPTHAEKALAYSGGGRVLHMYGPTETTVYATAYPIHSVKESAATIPIGKPLSNTAVYILDRYGKPVPVGSIGEMFIGGSGTARGYMNRVQLTAEKFIASPFVRGDRLYKTGDLARWLPDGNIEFSGRIDHQIKLRGFRIELGEIETQLRKWEEIKEVVVIAGESSGGDHTGEMKEDKYICVYFVAAKELSTAEIREYLAERLPDYMIPSYFMQLENLPLNPNGKVDRKALPSPAIKASGQYAPPRDEIEKKLAEIWAEVLNAPLASIGIEDDFFELGGHSLKATILISRIQKEFKVNVPLAELFKTQTIKALAAYIRTAGPGTLPMINDENLVLLKSGGYKGNYLFLVHAGTGEVEGYIEFCTHLSPTFNCWGIRADRSENLAPRNCTIEELSQKYIANIQKIQPPGQGPYYILGWSLGGTIAFEIVKQLEQMNEKIGLLALVDSYPPFNTFFNRTFLHRKEFKDTGEFNPGTEFKFLKANSILSKEIKRRFENVTDENQLWLELVEYWESTHFDVEKIKNMIAKFAMPVLSNYHQLGIRESVYYLNVMRMLKRARALYTPTGKIHTPAIHYFAASQTRYPKIENWNTFCHNPVTFHEIPGDHYSIFRKPDVEEFLRCFDGITKELTIKD